MLKKISHAVVNKRTLYVPLQSRYFAMKSKLDTTAWLSFHMGKMKLQLQTWLKPCCALMHKVIKWLVPYKVCILFCISEIQVTDGTAWLIFFNIEPHRKIFFFLETTNMTELKLCVNCHWMNMVSIMFVVVASFFPCEN
jgi:hypothetical protein